MYDLLVIGGGPAGYLAAERAAQGGMSVCLFEKNKLGGVCLNEGCIPSKALLNSAKIYEYATHGSAYGVMVDNVTLDHEKVMKRKEKVVKLLVSGVGGKMKKYHVTTVMAEATVLGKDAEGFSVSADGDVHKGKRLLIATGSVPIVPGIEGLKASVDAGITLTNRGILDLKAVPESLVVIGGGVIGLEMASYYAVAGSKVTVVEMLNHIGGPMEPEISETLQTELAKKGITFELSAKVVQVDGHTVKYIQEDQEKTVTGDHILLSIGRRAFTEGLGLENIGVKTERGAVVTDRFGKTNVSGVYVAGDVNGKSMLAHTAYREAEVCVNHMLMKKDTMRYNAVPAVIYTYPEVAAVGETESSAKEKGMAVKTVTLPMTYSGRYVAETERGSGFCKLVVDTKQNRLVGVHMIGSYVSEMIYGASLMIETELRIEDLKELVFPHPTVSEVIREALFEL